MAPGTVLALLTLAFHLATAAGYGWFRDELYYVACARRLDWGYVDLPPLTPLLVRGILAVAGPSLPALRALGAVAAAVVVLVTAEVARALGGGRRAQVVAGVCAMVAPIYVGTFALATPNALDAVLWAATLLVLARALAGGAPRLWLVAGALAGAGLQNKHTFAILPLALAPGLLLTPAWAALRTPWPWAGAAIAAAAALPHLAWQAAHGWPTLEFTANARAWKMAAPDVPAFLAQQVLVTNPAALPIVAAGLAFLLRARQVPAWRALGLTAVVAIAITAASGGKAYYVAPVYVLLFGAGGVAVARAAAGRGWLVPVALAPVVWMGAVIAPIAKPLLTQEASARWMQRLGIDQSIATGESHAALPLPQTFADMHGWPELAAAVARVHQALPDAERARACVGGRNYGEAAALELFGPALGLPRPISGHNSYWLWGPGGCDFRTVVFVGGSRSDLEALFLDVRQAATIECRWCMPHESSLPVWVLRRPRVPPAALWRAAKRFV